MLAADSTAAAPRPVCRIFSDDRRSFPVRPSRGEGLSSGRMPPFPFALAVAFDVFATIAVFGYNGASSAETSARSPRATRPVKA